jgi:hypothetical protein
MSKYTQLQIDLLNEYYQSGLNCLEACKKAGVTRGSFSYLMKKNNFTTRPKGFQQGNKTSGQFIKGPECLTVCHNCSKEFSIPKWEIERGRKSCSRQCHLEFLKNAKRGANHWNWKGGITNRWDKLHNSLEYKTWRLKIWQRDNFTCQECGGQQSKKNPLNAHHKKPKSKYPELILDLDNGQTLCRDCHDIVHYGRILHRSRHG